MDQKYKNVAMFWYYKDLDENLAWLTQKTEESKCNKGNFTFFYTQSKCYWPVNKKVETLPFLHQPHQDFWYPPSDSILGRSYHPHPPLISGEGVSDKGGFKYKTRLGGKIHYPFK